MGNTSMHSCNKYTQLSIGIENKVKCSINHFSFLLHWRRIPTHKQRETYALGIISLFPSLRDPFSTKGYVRIFCIDVLVTQSSWTWSFVLLFFVACNSSLSNKCNVQIWQTLFSCLTDRSISTMQKREPGSSPAALKLCRGRTQNVFAWRWLKVEDQIDEEG